MSKFKTLEAAQEAVRIGERSRIIFEILLSELGLEWENNAQIWHKLREVQNDYEEAIKMLGLLIKETHRQEGVSVSN